MRRVCTTDKTITLLVSVAPQNAALVKEEVGIGRAAGAAQ